MNLLSHFLILNLPPGVLFGKHSKMFECISTNNVISRITINEGDLKVLKVDRICLET